MKIDREEGEGREARRGSGCGVWWEEDLGYTLLQTWHMPGLTVGEDGRNQEPGTISPWNEPPS